MAELAYPVPVEVIVAVLGLPAHDIPALRRWADAIVARLDVQPVRDRAVEAAGDVAARELRGHLLAAAADPARRRPGGLFEELLDLAHDDRLSVDEAVSSAALLLLAGHETTSNLISAGLLALLRRPAEATRWRAGAVSDTAVDELLRYCGPVQLTQRVALEPLRLSGVDVRAGEIVAVLLGAANRDPEVFADAQRLDLGRDPNPHLAFGTGVHACLGAALARLEAGTALRAVLERWPQLRLDGRPTWRPTMVLRGVAVLPVRWHGSAGDPGGEAIRRVPRPVRSVG